MQGLQEPIVYRSRETTSSVMEPIAQGTQGSQPHTEMDVSNDYFPANEEHKQVPVSSQIPTPNDIYNL